MAGQENSLEDIMATMALAKPSSSITAFAGKGELWGMFKEKKATGICGRVEGQFWVWLDPCHP